MPNTASDNIILKRRIGNFVSFLTVKYKGGRGYDAVKYAVNVVQTMPHRDSICTFQQMKDECSGDKILGDRIHVLHDVMLSLVFREDMMRAEHGPELAVSFLLGIINADEATLLKGCTGIQRMSARDCVRIESRYPGMHTDIVDAFKKLKGKLPREEGAAAGSAPPREEGAAAGAAPLRKRSVAAAGVAVDNVHAKRQRDAANAAAAALFRWGYPASVPPSLQGSALPAGVPAAVPQPPGLPFSGLPAPGPLSLPGFALPADAPLAVRPLLLLPALGPLSLLDFALPAGAPAAAPPPLSGSQGPAGASLAALLPYFSREPADEDPLMMLARMAAAP
jgi:hypothetical protein